MIMKVVAIITTRERRFARLQTMGAKYKTSPLDRLSQRHLDVALDSGEDVAVGDQIRLTRETVVKARRSSEARTTVRAPEQVVREQADISSTAHVGASGDTSSGVSGLVRISGIKETRP